MKKKKVWLCALLLVIAVGAALGFLKKPEKTAPIGPVSGRDFMRASLVYDQGLRTLRGTQTMTAQNRTGENLDEIVLRLYMNGSEGCAASVSGVTVNGSSASFAQDADDPTVLRIRHSWASEAEISLGWTVMIKHAKTGGAAVVTLPSPAMHEDGAWRTDEYDALAEPSYGEAFDFTIEIDGEIAAQMRMARDASFALLPDGKVREKEVSDVQLRALAQDTGTAKALLAKAQEALGALSDAGFAYPYDTLTVAQGDTDQADGLALSGLIVLSTDEDGEQMRRRITRLIARQTFGVFVESDPWNAPWLSHTLASCAEMLAYRKIKGAAAYEERLYGELELATRLTRPAGVCVGAGVMHFGSDSEMTQVLRDAGAAMLLGIEQAVGEAAFVSALTAYVQDCGGGMGSPDALCRALERETGSSWDGYISDVLAF